LYGCAYFFKMSRSERKLPFSDSFLVGFFMIPPQGVFFNSKKKHSYNWRNNGRRAALKIAREGQDRKKENTGTMKKLVILGAGSGGTMMANKMRKDLDDDWSITLIDKDNIHYYQPGFLFVPFDINKPKEIRRSRRELLSRE
jgi:FlaA1/EpsC-like NDP-sugar epimerase